jgi:flagellar biosynthesis/type III secretory pathway chaperone
MNQVQKESYKNIVNLWQRMCDLHQALLETTAKEYYSLLSSELENTEKILNEKKLIIEKINIEEKNRKKLVNETLGPSSLDESYTFRDLKKHFDQFEIEREGDHLNNFNLILKDTIEKIKTQNKKNRIFINRALISLDGLKLPYGESKEHSLYNKDGTKQRKLNVKGA